MQWKTKLGVPVLAALGYLVTSFFIKIVPCQISPNIPNPSFSWALCTLNPDKAPLFGIQEVYWGITSQLSGAYLLSLGLIFVCCFIFLAPFARKSHSPKNKKGDERRFEIY